MLVAAEKIPEALDRLLKLHEDDKSDSFSTLLLAHVLRRSGKSADAENLLSKTDLEGLTGSIEYRIALAQQVGTIGQRERALAALYNLVRNRPIDPRPALGYIGLGFAEAGRENDLSTFPEPKAIGADT